MQTRREFTAALLAAGAAITLPGATLRALAQEKQRATPKKKILFLGGTGFIGPHIIRALLRDGHEVTLFNRGNRDELFPDLEFIQGNRIPSIDPGLAPLEKAVADGRRWDAVIDTSNVHRWVRDSAAILRDAVDLYVYTSSMSVYADNSTPDQDESAPLITMPDELADTIDRLPYDMNYFGAVKARSEQAALDVFPDRTLIVRPGLIVGPRDFSHRFTYWPWRVRAGGEVLAPGAPDHRISYIDARDLADFLAVNIANATRGIFNTVGPADEVLSIGTLLQTCRQTLDADATFTWIDEQFLAENAVFPWAHLPVWIPPADGYQGFHTRTIEKARTAGLKTRPLADTIRDTMLWFDNEYIPEAQKQNRPFKPGENAPGITPERERELLELWHRKSN